MAGNKHYATDADTSLLPHITQTFRSYASSQTMLHNEAKVAWVRSHQKVSCSHQFPSNYVTQAKWNEVKGYAKLLSHSLSLLPVRLDYKALCYAKSRLGDNLTVVWVFSS